MSALDLFAVLLWIAVVTSTVLLLRALRRGRPAPAGADAALHDLSEAAFLAGGPGAVVDAALVALLTDGRLVVGGPGIVQPRPGARAAGIGERAVLEALRRAPSGWLYQVRYAAMLDPAVQETGDGLAARGLLSPPGQGRGLRHWGVAQAAVCGVWVPLSLPLTFVAWALEPGPQVPFIVKVLPVLVGGVVMGAVCAKRAGQRVAPAGRRALAAMRARYAGAEDSYVRTSLFGLSGLRDPYLRAQLVPAARATRLAAAQSRGRTRATSGPSTSSTSSAELLPVLWCASSDSGSGGGGSGCGSSGSSCGGGGSSCGGSSSSCGGSSGSSCSSGSSSSSCSSSSGSSCSSSS
ncbi:TIGR04222 domain-containing membrane protein [Streptomyces sp. NBC_00249]|uniref:TIGR04222 domain-containing membrane protein n=1 Tax=Streptomyces sp. NBC_00249 TaxID=2975690 RepID=UPI00224CB3E4|nr:TIGR04222 domain-containing membrane protein [Streptomyces sp. NBC_00249]MCX5193736.1 TIGR04222 domain-containing membrane protein [Streptomyces sp. NBC_00249]